MNRAVSIATITALGLGMMAAPPVAATETSVVEHHQKGHLAKKLNGPGWTELVSGPMYAKNGRRMKVRVKVHAGKGPAGTTQTIVADGVELVLDGLERLLYLVELLADLGNLACVATGAEQLCRSPSSPTVRRLPDRHL